MCSLQNSTFNFGHRDSTATMILSVVLGGTTTRTLLDPIYYLLHIHPGNRIRWICPPEIACDQCDRSNVDGCIQLLEWGGRSRGSHSIFSYKRSNFGEKGKEKRLENQTGESEESETHEDAKAGKRKFNYSNRQVANPSFQNPTIR